jgi:hypothetical protein
MNQKANKRTRDQRSNAHPHPRPTPTALANSPWWQPPPRAPSSKATTAKIKPAILPPQQEQPDSSRKTTFLRQNKTPTHADRGIASASTRASNQPSFKEIGQKLAENEPSIRPYYATLSAIVARTTKHLARRILRRELVQK